MTLTYYHYGFIALWAIVMATLAFYKFSNNSQSKAGKYLGYSTLMTVLLGVIMFVTDYFKPDWLNLSVYAALSHIGILLTYYVIFPRRHYIRRASLYKKVLFSMILCSTAGVFASILLLNYLAVGVV